MKIQLFTVKPILLLSAMSLGILFNSLPALSITPQEVPNPQIKSGEWVSDKAGILSKTTEDELNEIIDRLESFNGSEIAIVTVSETSPSLSAKAFATQLFNDWGIGKQGENNGVLFLISVQDRRVEIESGSGIQKILPSSKVQQIIDTKILPKFKEKDFELGTIEGTKIMVLMLAPSLSKEVDSISQPAKNLGETVKLTLIWIGLGSLVAYLFWFNSKDSKDRRKANRCRKYTHSEWSYNDSGYTRSNDCGGGSSDGGSFGGGSSDGDGAGGDW